MIFKSNELSGKTARLLSIGLVSACLLNVQAFATETEKNMHTVVAGENLTYIADGYGVSVDELSQLNEIDKNDPLSVGIVLEIPSVDTTEVASAGVESIEVKNQHVVEYGDNLTHIARDYGVDLEKMIELNNLDPTQHLVIGTVIELPETIANVSEGEVAELASTEDIAVAVEEVVEVAATGDVAQAEEKTLEESATDSAEANNESGQTVTEATGENDVEENTYNGMGGDVVTTGEENLISVSFVNADIKDVLSVLALEMGKSIIYDGDDEVTISFSQENITPEDALSYAASLAEVEYVYDGDILLVAPRGDIIDTFSQEMYLTRIPLRNLTSSAMLEAFEGELQEFGFDSAQMLVAESNQKTVWLQATPKDLAKLNQIIYALDSNENIMPGSAATVDSLSTIKTSYVTAEEVNYLLMQIGLMPGIVMPNDPYTMYMVDSYGDVADARKIAAMLDVPTVEGEDPSQFNQYKLSNLTADTANQLLSTIADLEIITTDAEPMTLWMRGNATALQQANDILAEIDTPTNNISNNIHVIYLNNVTASEMESKLSAMNLVDVQIYTFAMPQFAENILIGCAPDEINNIRKIVTKLDVKSAAVTLPVDSAEGDGATTRLGARRMIIAEMSGISASNFKISGNVSKDNEATKYVLYLTASPEDIQRVRDIVAEIDGV